MTEAPNLKELIQRGQAAARVGRRAEARDYLRRAVALAPDHGAAWLELAGVEDDPAQKRACFQRVLDLDPDNVEARLGLEMLDGEVGPTETGLGLEMLDGESGVAGASPALEMLPREPAAPAPEGKAGDDPWEEVVTAASRQLEAAVGRAPAGQVAPDDQVLFCANHPTVETMLRCNRCGKPICTRCAVPTPVGYRCKQCVGEQQAAFYTGGPIDYVIGGAIALVLGGIASYLVTILGAWFIALILGPAIGIGIAEAVRFAVRRRRSRYLWLVVAAGIVVSALPMLLVGLRSLWGLVALGLYLVLAVGAAAARLRWG